MSKKLIKPTDAELEILQVLWQRGPSSVRDVHDILSGSRETGYTTTLKLMQIMLDKGLVKRNAEARSHIYEAGVQEADVQSQLLRRFVDSTFRGSASQLVMQVLGNHKASKKELEEIKALIEQIEKNRKP
ncbi:MAG TPA: BlaI/MecI/CopY family transcriptional regulator [Saprospiraceae bacterium]|nr:BlaI/MecI/CopY family transcriptional regulator [Saprospiraceae bacterium]